MIVYASRGDVPVAFRSYGSRLTDAPSRNPLM